MTQLSLEMLAWIHAQYGLEEERLTSGSLRISIGQKSATLVLDESSKSVRDHIYVSAYPVANWIAASWWRLLFESAPNSTPSTDWRMSHELAAAGEGFLWPTVRIVSDGEWADVSSHAAPAESRYPIRYLTNSHSRVPLEELRTTLKCFVELVLSRLETIGIANSPLRHLWNEVQLESGDLSLAATRRLEARLGYDPNEAPTTILDELKLLAATAGTSTSEEIASECSRAASLQELYRIVEISKSSGTPCKFGSSSVMRPTWIATAGVSPWERGWRLARELRTAANLDLSPLSNEKLSGLLETTSAILTDAASSQTPAPVSLAIREPGMEDGRLHLRKRLPTSRRFEFARIVADSAITNPLDDRWLIATDARTARQKLQRAFAAELLAPIDGVRSQLEGDYSEETIENVAGQFQVSPLLVRSQLANHGVMPMEPSAPWRWEFRSGLAPRRVR